MFVIIINANYNNNNNASVIVIFISVNIIKTTVLLLLHTRSVENTNRTYVKYQRLFVSPCVGLGRHNVIVNKKKN